MTPYQYFEAAFLFYIRFHIPDIMMQYGKNFSIKRFKNRVDCLKVMWKIS